MKVCLFSKDRTETTALEVESTNPENWPNVDLGNNNCNETTRWKNNLGRKRPTTNINEGYFSIMVKARNEDSYSFVNALTFD